MKTAAISELKARLSEYLLSVREGEEVIITDRGAPVARIVPVRRDACESNARLLHLEAAGLARVGQGTLPKEFWSLPRASDPGGHAMEALLAEREEGR